MIQYHRMGRYSEVNNVVMFQHNFSLSLVLKYSCMVTCKGSFWDLHHVLKHQLFLPGYVVFSRQVFVEHKQVVSREKCSCNDHWGLYCYFQCGTNCDDTPWCDSDTVYHANNAGISVPATVNGELAGASTVYHAIPARPGRWLRRHIMQRYTTVKPAHTDLATL